MRLHIEACIVDSIPPHQLSSFLPTPIGGNEDNYNDYLASLEQLVQAFYDHLNRTDECADVRARVNRWLMELRSSSSDLPIEDFGADSCGLISFPEGQLGDGEDDRRIVESLFDTLN